ncbi:acyltransferase family protein [Clostridium botulinum]|uniref:acyltransferase family protein n=1 Tax=Clostridium botulinum TaxID=1491 RepID=UPI000A498815|nr:acyltransferase [Clostridium botulinum]
MKRQEKLTNITLLSGIAIILVILGHSGCIYAGKWNYNVIYNKSTVLKYITCYIYSFHMQLFVFLSGYLYSYGKRYGKYKRFSEIVIKKIIRLLTPYILVGSLLVVPTQIIFKLDKVEKSYLKRVVYEIFLAHEPRYLWFILMLFNIFIIFYVIEKHLNKKNIVINLGIFFIVSVLASKCPNIYEIDKSFQYLLFFYMGYVFYENKKVVTLVKDKYILLFTIHILMFNYYYFIIDNVNIPSNKLILFNLFNIIIRRMIAFIGVGFVFSTIEFLISSMDKKGCILNDVKLFKNLSKYSYFIYLVHQPIMLVILKNIRWLQIKPIVVYNVLFWCTLMLSIGFAKIYYGIVYIYKHKWTKEIKANQEAM